MTSIIDYEKESKKTRQRPLLDDFFHHNSERLYFISPH